MHHLLKHGCYANGQILCKVTCTVIFSVLQLSYCKPGPITQPEVSPTVDPGVASSIPARSHTFLEIDLEIIASVTRLPLIQEGLLSVRESVCTKYWLTA